VGGDTATPFGRHQRELTPGMRSHAAHPHGARPRRLAGESSGSAARPRPHETAEERTEKKRDEATRNRVAVAEPRPHAKARQDRRTAPPARTSWARAPRLPFVG
jgi:hypothetical protein